MTPAQQNFTIIVNWKEKGFGCAKVCSYCNWRESVLLPHGSQGAEAIGAFISQCKKSFITISGGAEPLYKFDEYSGQLLSMIRIIQSHGFKVRIITREVQHIAKLRGIVDYFSISLDADVLEDIKRYQHEWAGMDIEYSLVLPPIPTAEIVKLKPQYAALRSTLGNRLVLRENLNSIYPSDLSELTFGHTGIVFVPKSLCLAGRYLSTIDSTGHEIVQDNAGLAHYLMGNPNIVLFGGMVKHLVNPTVHMEYGDIDLIALDADVIEALTERFGFTFRDVSQSASSFPRYFLAKSTRAGKTVQLILMHSQADALRFIHNAQYDVDRIGYSNRRFHFDAHGESATLHAINTKQVRTIKGPRNMGLFHIDRPLIEQRHRLKLVRKGFAIAE